MKKIKDNPNLVKDPHSKAIINKDKSGYQAALKRKEYVKQKECEIEELKSQIEQLTQSVHTLLAHIDKNNK